MPIHLGDFIAWENGAAIRDKQVAIIPAKAFLSTVTALPHDPASLRAYPGRPSRKTNAERMYLLARSRTRGKRRRRERRLICIELYFVFTCGEY